MWILRSVKQTCISNYTVRPKYKEYVNKINTLFICFILLGLHSFCDKNASSFVTVWQRGGELRQVLHAHTAHADSTRPAGHRQHRPERVRRLFLHQPAVPPSISARKRRMRQNPSVIPNHNNDDYKLKNLSVYC